MSIYRYIFADLLTNSILTELPLGGVTFNRMLNKPGNFQGSMGLGNENYRDIDIIEGTLPGRTALYIERTDLAGEVNIVWGGIIWSRTWQEQSLTFEYTGQTFESFFYLEDIRNTLQYTNTDQRNILRDLVTKMQAYAYRNINIIVPSSFSNNILRTVNFFNYDVWSFGTAIDYMIGYDQGFDYTIECEYDSSGNIIKNLLTDDVLGIPAGSTQLGFDYPGNIKNFWFPENASNGATAVSGVGAGDGTAMIRTISTNQGRLDAGYPELVQIYTNKDVSILNTLSSQVQANLKQLLVPVTVPTFEVNPEISPEFGSYSLGDNAMFNIESYRFNGIQTLNSRIVGWNVTPSSSDSQEQVSLVIDGQDT